MEWPMPLVGTKRKQKTYTQTAFPLFAREPQHSSTEVHGEPKKRVEKLK